MLISGCTNEKNTIAFGVLECKDRKLNKLNNITRLCSIYFAFDPNRLFTQKTLNDKAWGREYRRNVLNSKKPYVIGCAVLALDIKHAARKLGLDVGYKFLEGGLHERPDLLRTKLQEAIDEVSAAGTCSRIIVGYGVCGRGTVGVHARNVPLAIPKVHDCIALFLGGDRAYQDQFKRYPGTYYISAGWYEEKTEPLSQRRQSVYYGGEKLHYDQLVTEYGEGAATETFRFLSTWQKNYHRAAFIETGANLSPRYKQYAQDMAAEYGWKYEEITGSPALIEALLTTDNNTDEILVVPPGQVIEFNPMQSTLSANPIWAMGKNHMAKDETTILEDDGLYKDTAVIIKTGLGIDAGGTYTDTVIYALDQDKTICKSKALTTKWDFTVGIKGALAKLDQEKLKQVELVSLSTTLATNAIVEGEGQKVGMILMTPYGPFNAEELSYRPTAFIDGHLDITGKEITPVDERQARRVIRNMVEKDKVKAFAVSGYAGAINPAHELQVKQIIRKTTGLFVTCGHELSSILNFKTRAHTAMLNARIIPKLAKLLLDVEKVLASRGIFAPIVVVKGDGTLMSSEMAKERPVETILSGPAASVAGARHLTGLKDALVVDMGGTTTDTAALVNGVVSVCENGSNVDGQRTHVKALEIRTTGLGGDSLIKWADGQFSIGPRRVAPMAWLGATQAGTDQALKFLNRQLDRYTTLPRNMEIMALTGAMDQISLTPMEKKIVTLLQSRPFSINELMHHAGVLLESGLQLQRLEENFIIQRCGLTPTDLLHVTGRFDRWDCNTARQFCQMFSRMSKIEMPDMIKHLLDMGIHRLALELLKRQLDDETDADVLNTCPVCRTLIKNLFAGGSDQYTVRIDLKRPVIGIGAPIHFFLPQAAAAFGAKAILPENADVANAIGAITSDVVIKRQVRISPNPGGGFLVDGLVGARRFIRFEDADAFARDTLAAMVRDLARTAGTSSRKVTLTTKDKVSTLAGGQQIFIDRTIHAGLTGRPDIILKGNPLGHAAIKN
jgi:N-methylhydantoinase A/oxoprolinase/acetone carboxylase beta subunit